MSPYHPLVMPITDGGGTFSILHASGAFFQTVNAVLPRRCKKHEFLVDLRGSSTIRLRIRLFLSLDKDVVRNGVPSIVNANTTAKKNDARRGKCTASPRERVVSACWQ